MDIITGVSHPRSNLVRLLVIDVMWQYLIIFVWILLTMLMMVMDILFWFFVIFIHLLYVKNMCGGVFWLKQQCSVGRWHASWAVVELLTWKKWKMKSVFFFLGKLHK
jgi:hypothetical protein